MLGDAYLDGYDILVGMMSHHQGLTNTACVIGETLLRYVNTSHHSAVHAMHCYLQYFTTDKDLIIVTSFPSSYINGLLQS